MTDIDQEMSPNSEPVEIRDDVEEIANTIGNMPDVTKKKDPLKPPSKSKKPAKRDRVRANDSRSADVFGAAFDEFMNMVGVGGGDHAQKAAAGFTKECLDLCDDENTARIARLGLTGAALLLVISVPVIKIYTKQKGANRPGSGVNTTPKNQVEMIDAN